MFYRELLIFDSRQIIIKNLICKLAIFKIILYSLEIEFLKPKSNMP